MCPGPHDRRSWLKIGGLSLGALATSGDLSLAQLFAAQEDRTGADKGFSVILFWANGGPSHIDLFDLKPGAPAEYRGPFRPIRTAVPGMEITECLPNLARLGDKIAIVRSLHHNRGEHSGGTHRFLSGHPSRAANLNDAEFPEIGSVVARRLGGQNRDVPVFVANTKFYGGGPAYLGSAAAPFMPAPNPLTSTGNNVYDPVPIYRTAASVDNLSLTVDAARLQQRGRLLNALDQAPRTIDAQNQMDALDQFNRRALDILTSSRTRNAFDLTQEDQQTRMRYGDNYSGRSLLTCRRLVEAGVRFVQCQSNYRLRPETGRTSNWDDHSVNSHIFRAYEERLPEFDQAVSALIEDLCSRGLADHVLYIFLRRVRPHAADQEPGPERPAGPRPLAAGDECAAGGRRPAHRSGDRCDQPAGRGAGRTNHGFEQPAGDDLPPVRNRHDRHVPRPRWSADPHSAAGIADRGVDLIDRPRRHSESGLA
jgi:hypothetical protein